MRAIACVTAVVVLLTSIMLAAPQVASAGAVMHVVQRGENLYRIALRYSVTVDAIVRANRLADPERIQPGQVLTIPTQGAAARRAAGTGKRPSSAGTAPRTASRPKVLHVVARGDTLYAIARRYGTTVLALRQANGLRSDRIHVGQSLRIPGPGAARPAPVSVRATPLGPAPASVPVQRTTQALPAAEIGAQILSPRPMRVRRGPKSYFTMLALVVAETPLTILGRVDGWVEVQLPDGQSGWVEEDDLRTMRRLAPVDPAMVHGADIVREAMRYLGTRYMWGGQSSNGVDCSGFVYIVFSSRLPGLGRMSSYAYFQTGTPVDRANLLPGDLVFFTTYAPGPSHVGIYVGDGRFIHASSGARKVLVTDLDDAYYATRYLGARRLVNP